MAKGLHLLTTKEVEAAKTRNQSQPTLTRSPLPRGGQVATQSAQNGHSAALRYAPAHKRGHKGAVRYVERHEHA